MNKLKIILSLSLLASFLLSCTKIDDIFSPLGKGSFTFQSEKYDKGIVTKTPSASGLPPEFDVTINCPPGNAVTIFCMPSNSSGNFPIYDAMASVGTNKTWIAIVFQPNTTFYQGGIFQGSTGTITKTGSNSFTFSCQVYNSSKPTQKYTVTGQGSY